MVLELEKEIGIKKRKNKSWVVEVAKKVRIDVELKEKIKDTT